MGQKEVILAIVLGFIVVGGGVATVAMLSNDAENGDENNPQTDNNNSDSTTPPVDNNPSISTWNVTSEWNGENPRILGVTFDEDLANVTVNMVVFNPDGSSASISPLSFPVNYEDGTWSIEFPTSTPGQWLAKFVAMDKAGQSSELVSINISITPPSESLVEIKLLWTQPAENSSIGSLSGLLIHAFPETCSINFSPDGQMPLTTSVNNSSGEYSFEIDVNTTNLAGRIIADCGLFTNFDAVSVQVNLPLESPVEDADSDGIIDDSDICANTPNDEPVYADGCSDTQRDSDSDGISDALDLCPNTPLGEGVDANGCADSQKDVDGDGVSDALDLCPATPQGENVDADGCSNSQKDSDGDGISDDLDSCPNTPQGDVVGPDGCTLPDWEPADSWLCTDGQGPWVRDWNEENYGSNKANNKGASSAGASDDNAGPWFQCKITLSESGGKMIVDSNGIPNHDFLSTLGCCADENDYTTKITLSPTNDTTGGHSSNDCPAATGRWECAPNRGAVAVAINGVPMFGPEEGPGGDAVALHFSYFNEDRQPIELGWCTGHAAGPAFHYHYDAQCIFWEPEAGEDMSDYDLTKLSSSAHSPIIGWAWDGYPIYGMYGYDENDGHVRATTSSYVIERTNEGGDQGYNGIDDWNYQSGVGDLDECNGRWGPTPEYPQGIYHYVSTPLSGSPTMVTDANGATVGMIGFPYFLLCYHGIADVDGQDIGGGQGPPPPMIQSSGEMYSFSPPNFDSPSGDSPLYLVGILDFAILILVVVGITAVFERLHSRQKILHAKVEPQ